MWGSKASGARDFADLLESSLASETGAMATNAKPSPPSQGFADLAHAQYPKPGDL